MVNRDAHIATVQSVIMGGTLCGVPVGEWRWGHKGMYAADYSRSNPVWRVLCARCEEALDLLADAAPDETVRLAMVSAGDDAPMLGTWVREPWNRR